MAINTIAVPEVIAEDKPTAGSPGHTLFLKIDLEVDPGEDKPVPPVTAVYAPDPKQLTGNVNVLLWLHGDKDVWSHTRKDHLYFWGKSVREYLTIDECKLREFIQQATPRNFLLVIPTLADHSGGRKGTIPGGLLWTKDEYNSELNKYLTVILTAVNDKMGLSLTGVNKLIFAAHSGGGHLLTHLLQFSGDPVDKVNEVWCFDCTYWGAKAFIDWGKRAKSKLWVYSTGGHGSHATGDFANEILEFEPKSPAGTTVEVLIDNYPSGGKSSSTRYFTATYQGSAGGHYEGIKKYLPILLNNSPTLKAKTP